MRQNFVLLSVRNRSYVVAGIMMAITAAILLIGVLYYAWCHSDGWSWAYWHIPLNMPDPALQQANSQDSSEEATSLSKDRDESESSLQQQNDDMPKQYSSVNGVSSEEDVAHSYSQFNSQNNGAVSENGALRFRSSAAKQTNLCTEGVENPKETLIQKDTKDALENASVFERGDHNTTQQSANVLKTNNCDSGKNG